MRGSWEVKQNIFKVDRIAALLGGAWYEERGVGRINAAGPADRSERVAIVTRG